MTGFIKRYDFPVEKVLRQCAARFCGISVEGDNIVIEFVDKKDKVNRIQSYITGDKHNDIDSVKNLVESRLSFFFDQAATDYCTGKLVDVLDRMYDTDKMRTILDRVKKTQKAEARKLDKQSGEGTTTAEKQIFEVKKYTGVSTVNPNGQGIAEAVLINGQPFFAHTINRGRSVTFYKELETQDNMILRPPSRHSYPANSAYEFESEEELMASYVQRVLDGKDTIYKIYQDTRKFYTKDYFVDTDPHNSTLLSTYTVNSYFQDKFSTVPYIWLIGDNGSGKNSVLMTYSWMGYRVFYMAGASGANICEYLGTVEEGAGTLAEDELGDLDKDDYKRLLYMTGYASGGQVPKVLDAGSSSRKQRNYHSYCQKMSASENLPSMKFSKGVLDREFIIKCVKGYPKYNAKITKKRTHTPEVERLIHQLQDIRKRLFAFRLVHYDDMIEEVSDKVNISGRALELTESVLQLFYKYKTTPEEEKIFNEEILPALSHFLKDRMGRRNESLEARLYPILRKFIEDRKREEFTNDEIFDFVWSELDGREIPGKDGVFYAPDLNRIISRSKLMGVLEDKFKAAPTRIFDVKTSTNKRGHIITKDTLERVRASYEDPWEIKIQNNNNNNNNNTTIEDITVQQNQVNHPLGEKGSNSENSEASKPQNSQESLGEEAKPEREHDIKVMADSINTPKEPPSGESSKNTSPLSEIPGLGGLPGLKYSIEDIIMNAMNTEEEEGEGETAAATDSSNKKKVKDYFTKDDFVYAAVMTPNADFTIDEAEQTLQALIEDKDKMIEEFEPGKFRPPSPPSSP